jgi:hypothetical protein
MVTAKHLQVRTHWTVGIKPMYTNEIKFLTNYTRYDDEQIEIVSRKTGIHYFLHVSTRDQGGLDGELSYYAAKAVLRWLEKQGIEDAVDLQVLDPGVDTTRKHARIYVSQGMDGSVRFNGPLRICEGYLGQSYGTHDLISPHTQIVYAIHLENDYGLNETEIHLALEQVHDMLLHEEQHWQ